MPKQIAIAMGGASGAPYFLRLVERLRAHSALVLHLLASEGGKRVLLEESGLKWSDALFPDCQFYPTRDIGARLASGSNRLDALVVIPCSMNSVSAMAYGLADNLLTRAAAVQLKERRKLILVPRETPLSLPNLRALTACAEAGALIMPAMPSFYHQPQSIHDLVDSLVDRVIDQLELDDPTIRRWKA